LGLARRSEIIGEYAAASWQLRRLEPVHVIVNVAHASGELFTSVLQPRQTLGDSSPFTPRKQSSYLLIFASYRAQDWICLTNKQKQRPAQLSERLFFRCRRFLPCETALIK
jgi:hypothetical protein